VQAWIVGHRTVLGKIKVDLSSIIVELLTDMGYRPVTSLKRQCYFKRLPHHINCTIDRKREIQTMVEEHIIIMEKPC
jgi:hypothetical protein